MDPTFFIAMSYGAAALVVVVELALLAVRRKQALERIEAERDLEATD